MLFPEAVILVREAREGFGQGGLRRRLPPFRRALLPPARITSLKLRTGR